MSNSIKYLSEVVKNDIYIKERELFTEGLRLFDDSCIFYIQSFYPSDEIKKLFVFESNYIYIIENDEKDILNDFNIKKYKKNDVEEISYRLNDCAADCKVDFTLKSKKYSLYIQNDVQSVYWPKCSNIISEIVDYFCTK